MTSYSTGEAAKIVGLTPGRLRQIAQAQGKPTYRFASQDYYLWTDDELAIIASRPTRPAPPVSSTG